MDAPGSRALNDLASDRRGFGTPIEPLILVVVIGIIAACAIPFLSNKAVPKELRSGDPATVMVPECTEATAIASGTYREGLGILGREISGGEDVLVLARSVNTSVILWVAGITVMSFVLLWMLFRDLPAGKGSAPADGAARTLASRLPESLAMTAGLTFSVVGSLGVLYLLATIAVPLRVPHEVTVSHEGVQWVRRGLPYSIRTLDVGVARVAGVDAASGLRIFYRTEERTVRAISIPIANDEAALATACSAVGILQLERAP